MEPSRQRRLVESAERIDKSVSYLAESSKRTAKALENLLAFLVRVEKEDSSK